MDRFSEYILGVVLRMVNPIRGLRVCTRYKCKVLLDTYRVQYCKVLLNLGGITVNFRPLISKDGFFYIFLQKRERKLWRRSSCLVVKIYH